ncbi:hypothetical protein TD95_000359 [Thielaviopsis punctulata]|uniref:NmrA-like domain-containing protein n=1 Tax=Thielaviopsis punctulata TaxID=72032 RepID=A0A0F4ZBF2_9PEZI|nr:hypothetical protein TD95_000359 [Thielaviopsis punctulata]
MASPKFAVIVGATGNQGGAVARRFLQAGFRVRGICRNAESDSARALAALGAEIYTADLNEGGAALTAAFAGANVIFSVTQYWEPFFAGRARAAQMGVTCRRFAYDVEVQQGRNIADAAAATAGSLDDNGFLVSTLSHARTCSSGRLTELYHFDAKAEVFPGYVRDKYPELAAKMSCIHTGYFYTSYKILPTSWLGKKDDGSIEMAFTTDPAKRVPHLMPNLDMGNFTFAVYQMPPGKAYMAAGTVCTWPEWIAAWSKVTGVSATYRQASREEMIASTNDQMLGEEIEDMYSYTSDPGYDGGMDLLYAEDLVKAGIECPMTPLEDWLKTVDWSEWLP